MHTWAAHDEAPEPLGARVLHEIGRVINEEGLFRGDASDEIRSPTPRPGRLHAAWQAVGCPYD